jgi:hypothetical protein
MVTCHAWHSASTAASLVVLVREPDVLLGRDTEGSVRVAGAAGHNDARTIAFTAPGQDSEPGASHDPPQPLVGVVVSSADNGRVLRPVLAVVASAVGAGLRVVGEVAGQVEGDQGIRQAWRVVLVDVDAPVVAGAAPVCLFRCP